LLDGDGPALHEARPAQFAVQAVVGVDAQAARAPVDRAPARRRQGLQKGHDGEGIGAQGEQPRGVAMARRPLLRHGAVERVLARFDVVQAPRHGGEEQAVHVPVGLGVERAREHARGGIGRQIAAAMECQLGFEQTRLARRRRHEHHAHVLAPARFELHAPLDGRRQAPLAGIAGVEVEQALDGAGVVGGVTVVARRLQQRALELAVALAEGPEQPVAARARGDQGNGAVLAIADARSGRLACLVLRQQAKLVERQWRREAAVDQVIQAQHGHL